MGLQSAQKYVLEVQQWKCIALKGAPSPRKRFFCAIKWPSVTLKGIIKLLISTMEIPNGSTAPGSDFVKVANGLIVSVEDLKLILGFLIDSEELLSGSAML